MKYNRLDAGAGRGNVSKVLKEKRDPNIVLVPPFIYLIVVRLKFVTLPDLLWGHVLRRFSSLFFSPLFFILANISKKKGWKFREQISSVREQPSPGLSIPLSSVPFYTVSPVYPVSRFSLFFQMHTQMFGSR